LTRNVGSTIELRRVGNRHGSRQHNDTRVHKIEEGTYLNVSGLEVSNIATQAEDKVVERDLARATRISVAFKLVINAAALLGNRNHNHLWASQHRGLTTP
jgi:hypothetical protein